MTILVLGLHHQTFYRSPIHYQTLVGVELGYLAGVGLATRHPRFFASQKAMWRGQMCPRFRKVRIPISVPLKVTISIHTLSQSYENSVFKKLCKDINFFSFNIKMAQQIRLWLMYFAFNSPLWRKHLTVISVPRIVIHVTNPLHLPAFKDHNHCVDLNKFQVIQIIKVIPVLECIKELNTLPPKTTLQHF